MSTSEALRLVFRARLFFVSSLFLLIAIVNGVGGNGSLGLVFASKYCDHDRL